MYQLLYKKISQLYSVKVTASGIGIFRFLYGLVTLQEICFLLYFNHLIFDPIPYLDVEFPMIYFFLCLWAMIAICLTLGYRSQQSIIANYVFWIVFVNFTPMQRDFDGGFDLFMIGTNFFMIFMPIEKSFALDQLRNKLLNPFKHYSQYEKSEVTILAYTIPVTICLGFMYFDSVIHKMFAEHWRNGLGAWLPSTMPYYISSIDLSWFLNQEIIQKTIGYIIIVFQFTFLFFLHLSPLRPLFFIIGISIHLGITVALNIYPFGISMLIFYCLIIPLSWYKKIGRLVTAKTPSLLVFYDDQSHFFCRTILTIKHFDILNCIEFKSIQSTAKNYPVISKIKESVLLTALHALDKNNQLLTGAAVFPHILVKMRYLAVVGYFLKLPLISSLPRLACKKFIHKSIANSSTQEHIAKTEDTQKLFSLYDKFFEPQSAKLSKLYRQRISKILFVLFLFQINSTIHYGLVYRLEFNKKATSLTATLADISNSVIQFSHAFFGITPHPLYLHDHFEGYNHLIAITYTENQGIEKWLPFVKPDGRLESPNWGRVHSMWANIAVTPNIDNQRLTKFIMKTTAFWGIKSGIDLENSIFQIKMKRISSPTYWVHDLLKQNLSGKWKNIGTATWQDKSIKISLPDNINRL